MEETCGALENLLSRVQPPGSRSTRPASVREDKKLDGIEGIAQSTFTQARRAYRHPALFGAPSSLYLSDEHPSRSPFPRLCVAKLPDSCLLAIGQPHLPLTVSRYTTPIVVLDKKGPLASGILLA